MSKRVLEAARVWGSSAQNDWEIIVDIQRSDIPNINNFFKLIPVPRKMVH